MPSNTRHQQPQHALKCALKCAPIAPPILLQRRPHGAHNVSPTTPSSALSTRPQMRPQHVLKRALKRAPNTPSNAPPWRPQRVSNHSLKCASNALSTCSQHALKRALTRWKISILCSCISFMSKLELRAP